MASSVGQSAKRGIAAISGRMSSIAVDCRGLTAALESSFSTSLRLSQGRSMTDAPHPGSPASVERTSDDRLDSWKEIAAFMKRDVKTVQRWEKREGMPVHRHVHDKLGSVYAFRADLDAWGRNRRLSPSETSDPEGRTDAAVARRWPWLWPLVGAGAIAAVAFGVWRLQTRADDPRNALTDARFLQLTNFDGIEQAAAAVARRKTGGFPVESRRSDGRLGHPGRHWTVSQPDARSRARHRQPVGASARTSRLTDRSSPSGHAGSTARNRRSASGAHRSSAARRGPICMMLPNSTGRLTALASSTTRPHRATRCSCGTVEKDRRRNKSSRLRRVSTVTFLCGPRIRRSSISSRDRFPITWTSGGSGRPAEPRSGSRSTIRTSAIRYS